MSDRILPDDLLLRPWQESDLADVARIGADPLMPRFFSLWPSDFTVESAGSYLRLAREGITTGKCSFWAVTDAASSDVLGSVELWKGDDLSVGYWVAPEARGQGITPRAVRAVLEHELPSSDYTEVHIETHPENVASQRVALKLGFEFAGVIPYGPYKDGCTVAHRYRAPRSAFAG
jgi:RimJ/RimL family protein N-acetyltransferase